MRAVGVAVGCAIVAVVGGGEMDGDGETLSITPQDKVRDAIAATKIKKQNNLNGYLTLHLERFNR